MGKSKARRKGHRKSSLLRKAPYPNQGILREYLHRAESLEVNEAYHDAVVARMRRYRPLQQSREFEQFKAFHPRTKLRERLTELLLGVSVERHVVLRSTPECITKLMFNDDDTVCFVLEEDFAQRIVRRSLTYSSRDRCKKDWMLERIEYIARVTFEEYFSPT